MYMKNLCIAEATIQNTKREWKEFSRTLLTFR